MYKEFYRNGLCEIDFKSEKIDNLLHKIVNDQCKKDYSLVTKYPGTFDLRPDAISYDDVFIEALRDNNIKEKIREATLKDYSLFHVQVRVSKASEYSYMDWHRDTYYDSKGDLMGKAPHGVKIIYYPKFSEKESDRLLYLLGSNRILFPTNSYDNQLFNLLEVKKVKTSSEKATLFDISGMHAVCPEEKGKKSVRLIYGFLDKKQILDDHIEDNLHIETMKRYEEI